MPARYTTHEVVDDPDREAFHAHTAEVAGYLIEGHVPAAAIERLLAERPDAIGLALPGMPADSPRRRPR